MKRNNISSSVIESIGYGRYSSKLEVEFKNGDIFQYLKVPTGIYESFMCSKYSLIFFENFINNVYDYKKVA